jgi:hypothetical protein
VVGYALKADIRHYFETVDHEALISIISKRIKDEDVLWLIRAILSNHKTKIPGKGMPLGNLTSQFFANVYLAELDEFVKHKLKAKYYMRYVDDFIILERNLNLLEKYLDAINGFLTQKLKIALHPEKSRIIPLRGGITLLGFRAFYHCRILKKSNQRRIWKRLAAFGRLLKDDKISRERIMLSLAGWDGYAMMGDTYNLRMEIQRQAGRLLGSA